MAARTNWHGWRQRLGLLAMVGLAFLYPAGAFGYSVQTHEQLVDLAWKPAIVPLLLARYPGLTQAQIDEAHAFAYGGCAIQDVGYYPFGNAFFSNLTHYVRSGDFIRSLLRNARTPDELAFAVGAMTHYIGDTTGHSMAINPSVAQEFPKLAARFGPSVFYDENPHAHVRVEFAFDINELSKRRFAPSAYLRHVGLQVATDLLGRAFFETYGISLTEILSVKREQRSVRGYEFSVRRFLPRIAYAETVLHRRRMPADVNDADFQALEKALKQAEFENGWDQYRKKAGIGTYTLAGLIYILPPIGPLALLRIKGPDSATEQEYVKSVNASTAAIRRIVGDVTNDASKIAGDLPNRDLDTGLKTAPGTYRLTDETYAQLLARLTEGGNRKIPSGLKDDVQQFYADPGSRNATRKDVQRWAEVQKQLAVLDQLPTVPEP